MASKKVTTTSVEETVAVEPAKTTGNVTTSSVDVPQTKNNTVLIALLITLIVLLLLGVGFILAGDQVTKAINVILNTKSVTNTDTDKDTDETPEDPSSEEPTDTTGLVITSPKEDEIVEGQILVQGTVPKGYDVVYVSIEDKFAAEEIGNDLITPEWQDLDTGEYWKEGEEVNSFSVLLKVVSSPSVIDDVEGMTDATISVSARKEGEDEVSLEEYVFVNFEYLEGKDNKGNTRLKLVGPLENQTLISYGEGYELLVVGKMRDFFEGTMNVRILDSKGKTLLEDSINASGDNYGQYSDFKEILKDTDSATTQKGKVVFYEISAKDGSEDVLLEVPIYIEYSQE